MCLDPPVFHISLHGISLQIEDEGVLRLLYDEARVNILAGRFPCDPETWTGLGALSFAMELGVGLDDQKATAALR
jgi:hypothetical protein